MLPTGSFTPTLVAMIARARRKIAAHFLAQHAVRFEEAVRYVPDRPILRHQFERMRSRGVVRDGADGTYWLDVPALAADTERRQRVLVPIVLALVLVAAAIPLFFYRG